MAVTKHNFLVTDPQDIPRIIHEAFHIATTGRPGPVLVDIPKDIVDPVNPRSAMTWYDPDSVPMELPGYHPQTEGDPALIQSDLKRLLSAGAAVRVRIPLIPGITDTDENLAGLAEVIGSLAPVQAVDLLPYNPAGEHKADRLCIPRQLPSMQTQSRTNLDHIQQHFKHLPISFNNTS